MNGILNAMRIAMDGAGRVVIPKALRDRLGLVPGELEAHAAGGVLTIEVPAAQPVEREGKLFLPPGGEVLTENQLREFRLADQR